MGKKVAPPIVYNENWHIQLYRRIMSVIIKYVFDPLIAELTQPQRHDNAKPSPLEKALRAGTVQYQGGAFRGSINATISKEIKALGGKFIRGAWRLPSPAMPGALQIAIADNVKAMALISVNIDQMTRIMPKVLSGAIKSLEIEDLGLEGISRISREFKNTVGRAMAVMPDIGETGKKELIQRYFDSDQLPIRKKLLREFEDRSKAYVENFAQETVEKLRRGISELIADGQSRYNVRAFIGQRLDIARDRAKFIARQETSLLTSNFKEVQYKQAGIDKYIWRTVGDNRVRDTHQDLNGKVFTFDSPPPAEYFSTGRPENPGHDFNCRCVALPIIEF